MIYHDLRIGKPKGTKYYKRNGSVYVYHVLESKYIPEKKYNVDKKVCIGKMIDEQYMNPNDNYFKYYDHQVETMAEPPLFSDSIKMGNNLVISKVLKDIDLLELIDSIHGEDSKLIMDLISYFIVCEDSVMQHYRDYAFEHGLFSNKIVDDTYISKMLNDRISYADTQLFLQAWNKMQTKEEVVYISYDSTNMNTVSEGIEMAEFGHAKDDDEKPQVNISYAINQENGRPLFQELYPGSLIDNGQCKFMVDKAKEYGYSNVGFLLDRGYCASENIKYFDRNKFDFLMMMKTNQAFVKEAIQEVMMKLKLNVAYFIESHNVYGTTVKKKLYAKDERERSYHIYYDEVRAAQQRIDLMNYYRRVCADLDKKVDAKITKREDVGKYTKAFKLHYDDNGYLRSYEQKIDYIQKESEGLGYFVLVSSKEISAKEALDIYRNRDSIEKVFRSLKSWLGFGTFRVHGQTALEAKSHLIFLASIVRNEISQRMKPLKEKDRKNYTVPSIIRELDKMTIIKNTNGEYVRRYALTSKQKKILAQFSITEKDFNEFVACYNKRLVTQL